MAMVVPRGSWSTVWQYIIWSTQEATGRKQPVVAATVTHSPIDDRRLFMMESMILEPSLTIMILVVIMMLQSSWIIMSKTIQTDQINVECSTIFTHCSWHWQRLLWIITLNLWTRTNSITRLYMTNPTTIHQPFAVQTMEPNNQRSRTSKQVRRLGASVSADILRWHGEAPQRERRDRGDEPWDSWHCDWDWWTWWSTNEMHVDQLVVK